ncbi:MAG: BatD family protein [Candidatus Methanoperedens sp.]|nr:BatD family protein [Candidatus Methanoperedens sp.]
MDIGQFQESTIKILIENSGTSEVKAIEIMDSIHLSFDLMGGDFPNPKKFDSIRAGESREVQYTIKSKESGAFTIDPATVTYADSDGNIQEVKSEAVSIKVVPSTDGGSSGSNTGQNSKSASVSLHGEKTDVVMGEDILLRLSAVNLITKPKMHVQVIIIPPSGMSVTSSEFSKSAAGQFTANYQLEPGDGKDIEVRIRSNQVGDFNVNGRIIYYFGDDKEKAEDQTLNLPIKVRKEPAPTAAPAGSAEVPDKSPGFEIIAGIIGIAGALVLRKK